MERIKRCLQIFLSAVIAGVFIGIGGTALALCTNQYIGVLLFCIGLYTICTFEFKLYTGKVGYVLDGGFDALSFANLALIWLGNLCGTVICGIAITTAIPEVMELTSLLCTARLAQDVHKTGISSIMCGVLMYVAVDSYHRDGQAKYIGIFLCVPTFLLCGFEHSIADMFYFAAAREWSISAIAHIAHVSIGNAVGALLLRATLRR